MISIRINIFFLIFTLNVGLVSWSLDPALFASLLKSLCDVMTSHVLRYEQKRF